MVEPPKVPDWIKIESALKRILGPLIIMSHIETGWLYATSIDDFENNVLPNWRKVGRG